MAVAVSVGEGWGCGRAPHLEAIVDKEDAVGLQLRDGRLAAARVHASDAARAPLGLAETVQGRYKRRDRLVVAAPLRRAHLGEREASVKEVRVGARHRAGLSVREGTLIDATERPKILYSPAAGPAVQSWAFGFPLRLRSGFAGGRGRGRGQGGGEGGGGVKGGLSWQVLPEGVRCSARLIIHALGEGCVGKPAAALVPQRADQLRRAGALVGIRAAT